MDRDFKCEATPYGFMRFGRDVEPLGDWYHADGVDRLIEKMNKTIDEAEARGTAKEREATITLLERWLAQATTTQWDEGFDSACRQTTERIRSRGSAPEAKCNCGAWGPDAHHIGTCPCYEPKCTCGWPEIGKSVPHHSSCPLYVAPAKLQKLPDDLWNRKSGTTPISELIKDAINALVDRVTDQGREIAELRRKG